ncbi:MAG: hypothetical protein IT242_00175 [Bacteroidia bacterium]|nr:hypothetical protein [Bacteroidia bacterium]
MKRISPVIFLLTMLCFYQAYSQRIASLPGQEFPVLKLDENHNLNADPKKYNPIASYSSGAAGGLVLDARGYTFKAPSSSHSKVNTVRIDFEDNSYITPWHGRDTLILDVSTLRPLYGAGAFKGFTKGQKLLISIGFMSDSTQYNRGVTFFPSYTTYLYVK